MYVRTKCIFLTLQQDLSVALNGSPVYYESLFCYCSTWKGPPWSEVQSLQSVLLSIQTLLNDKPYHNEPGYHQVRKYIRMQRASNQNLMG